jgi:hypothetical protein
MIACLRTTSNFIGPNRPNGRHPVRPNPIQNLQEPISTSACPVFRTKIIGLWAAGFGVGLPRNGSLVRCPSFRISRRWRVQLRIVGTEAWIGLVSIPWGYQGPKNRSSEDMYPGANSRTHPNSRVARARAMCACPITATWTPRQTVRRSSNHMDTGRA